MSRVITGGSAPRLIDGRFALSQRLGGGGMGVVWRAWDNALHRDVALKEVLPPDPDEADPVGAREIRARVLREARALAQLRHPNVVIIHHIVDTPEHSHPWLVMELVTGGSLSDRLAHGPLTVPEAARIGRGVLSALRAAHAVGIQHRDIKPGNVLLRPDGSPVLTDFGIAAMQDVTSLTMSGSVVGSPEYIAPERLRGEEGNPASDLWSLGMMLYVAVEGRHPLARATMLATLTAVLDEQLPPPVQAGPLGPALVAVLAKDPRHRPTAEQLDHMLAAAEYGQYPQQPSRSLPPFPQPPTGSQPAWPQLPMGATTSSSFPFGTGGWAQQQQPPPTGSGPVPRPARRARTAGIALSAVVLVLAGALTWFLLPDSNDPGSNPAALRAAHQAESTTTPAESTTTEPTTTVRQAPANLLTPAGVRATVSALTSVMGKKALELVVYSEYATAEAPTAADPKVYDDVRISGGGQVTHSPGGEVDTDMSAPIDLTAIDWNILPGLLSKAEATLKVPHPTMVYLIVDSDMNIDDNGDIKLTPVIRIYRTDDYRDGMLVADLKGHILDTSPAS
jgi:serine/threonine protein kinase